MKRRRGRPWESAEARAEERVERVFHRLVERGVPLVAGWPLGPDRERRALRRLAQRRAIEAWRDGLLEEAWERVSRAYAARLGNMGAWTGIAAFSLPYSSRERAESQMAIRDLVTAAVVEDLVPHAVAAGLRADGERLLGSLDDGEPHSQG